MPIKTTLIQALVSLFLTTLSSRTKFCIKQIAYLTHFNCPPYFLIFFIKEDSKLLLKPFLKGLGGSFFAYNYNIQNT